MELELLSTVLPKSNSIAIKIIKRIIKSLNNILKIVLHKITLTWAIVLVITNNNNSSKNNNNNNMIQQNFLILADTKHLENSWNSIFDRSFTNKKHTKKEEN